MPDDRTEAAAVFAIRIASDLLTALAVKGLFSPAEANALIDDALNALLQSHPEHEQLLREIAATLTAQTNLTRLDLERKLRK